MSYKEKHTRSLAKAVSYRALSIIMDISLVFALTRKIELTLSIVIISNLLSTFLYYFHERIWDRFHYGRKIIPDKEIG